MIVRIWGNYEDGNYACGHILKDHSAEVRAVTVHSTNKYFVSASLDSLMEKGSSTVYIFKWET
ncbi:hypothetical protein F2Q69_00014099 [Brassica cretica]|uniref:Pre-mRNA-processing factor 19 n=1 Tax=Brassica cretica TaxID=69181 RepID=A0A8S9R0V6_BRACR|nr:hypothetical protein F2Q69_00014099 [Brassica cretica]